MTYQPVTLFIRKMKNSSNHRMPAFTALDPEDRQMEIEAAINDLNERVAGVTSAKPFTQTYVKLIEKAMLSAKLSNWREARTSIWRATFLLNRAIESRNTDGMKLWLILGLPIAIGLIILVEFMVANVSSLEAIKGQLLPYIPFMYMGALGGITISIWGIVKHSVWLDFDDDFKLWYLFKPTLGAIFGLISILFIKAGFFAFGIEDAEIIDAATHITSDSLQVSQAAAIIPPGSTVAVDSVLTAANSGHIPPLTKIPALYVVAFLAGFSERFFIRITDRVMTAIFGGDTIERHNFSEQYMRDMESKGWTELQISDQENQSSPSHESSRMQLVEPDHPGLP